MEDVWVLVCSALRSRLFPVGHFGSLFFFFRSEVKRQDAEVKQVDLVQEKNDLSLQLQAVSRTETC